MSGLERGADAGGLRYFLRGKPVPNGTGLELRLPGGLWTRVRFETRWDDRLLRHEGYLVLSLGHELEERFEVRVEADAPRGGGLPCLCYQSVRNNTTGQCTRCDALITARAFFVFDKKRLTKCTTTERVDVAGDSYLAYPELEGDAWPTENEARRQADALQAVAGELTVDLPLSPAMELRWSR